MSMFYQARFSRGKETERLTVSIVCQPYLYTYMSPVLGLHKYCYEAHLKNMYQHHKNTCHSPTANYEFYVRNFN